MSLFQTYFSQYDYTVQQKTFTFIGKKDSNTKIILFGHIRFYLVIPELSVAFFAPFCVKLP